jgi:O-antigen/teichoic acid export membrane protein
LILPDKFKQNKIFIFYLQKLHFFIKKIDNSPLWKGTIIIGSGTAFAQIIVLITTPIITRLYTPSDFGLLSVFMAIIAILTVLASLRYEYAIPIPKDNNIAANLLILCIALTTIFSIFLLVSLLTVGEYIFVFFNYQELSAYYWLIPLAFFGSGIYQSLSYWATRQRDYSLFTITQINQSLGGSLTKIVLGFLSIGPFGLLIGYLISSCVGIGTFVKAFREKDRPFFKDVSIPNIKAVAMEYWQFPVFTAPGTLAYAFSLQMPIFFLTFMYDIQVVGNYTLAYMVLALPFALIGTSIAQVFWGEAAKNVRENPKYLKELQKDTTIKLIIFSLPCIGLPALLAPWFFPLFFGTAWADAGLFCLPLTLVAISQFIVNPTNKLVIYGHNDWNFAFNIIRIIIFFGAFLICSLLNFIPIVTLFVYGIVTIFTQIVLYFLNIRAINCLTRNNI